MKREGKVVMEKVPPGPDNPLGKYWIPLSVPGYGIHSTIWPESIGHSTSHGCIRMATEDIENLFRRIKSGTAITIVYEPLKLALTSEQKIFLEVHPNTYQKSFSYWNHLSQLAHQNGLSGRIDWGKVVQVLNQRNGLAEEITRSNQRVQDPEKPSLMPKSGTQGRGLLSAFWRMNGLINRFLTNFN